MATPRRNCPAEQGQPPGTFTFPILNGFLMLDAFLYKEKICLLSLKIQSTHTHNNHFTLRSYPLYVADIPHSIKLIQL